MTSIRINVDKPYDVLVGHDLIKDSGKLIANLTKSRTAVIITDDIVNELYASAVTSSLENSGFKVLKFVFDNGEHSKCATIFISILEFLGENGITRDDMLVALGGGVVGDICGFAASCYLRGIDFVQIPTTILASVDSSVGGKTAIDLNSGKNLAGSFYQPKLVICDIDCMKTLKPETVADGYAEIIKYGAIFDIEFLKYLDENTADLEYCITKSVQYKADVVENDVYDRGERMSLNFGHTLAHSVEKLSKFSTTHGSAVAIGMVLAAKISAILGFISPDDVATLRRIVVKYGHDLNLLYSPEDMYKSALVDKKMGSDGLKFICLESLGKYKVQLLDIDMFKTLVKEAIEEELC